MNLRNIHKMITDKNLGLLDKTIWATLRSGSVKGPNYDPYRKIGYTITNQSPTPIKCNVRYITGNSLIARNLGLTQSGAIEIMVEDSKVNFFKICEKIVYDDDEYTPYRKALGKKIIITKAEFGMSRIVLFKVES